MDKWSCMDRTYTCRCSHVNSQTNESVVSGHTKVLEPCINRKIRKTIVKKRNSTAYKYTRRRMRTSI